MRFFRKYRIWMFLPFVLVATFLTFADTVTTTDGNVFEGSITDGFPDPLVIETQTGTLSIKQSSVATLTLGSPTSVTTTNGSEFKGTILSDLSEKLHFELEYGEISINWGNIATIRLEGKTVDPGTSNFDVTIETANGSELDGVLMEFPAEIRFETDNGSIRIDTGSLMEIEMGNPTSLRAQDGSIFLGRFLSNIPKELSLKMGSNTRIIELVDVAAIRFRTPVSEVDKDDEEVVVDPQGVPRPQLPFHISSGLMMTTEIGWQGILGLGYRQYQMEVSWMPVAFTDVSQGGTVEINGGFVSILVKNYFDLGPARGYGGGGYFSYYAAAVVTDPFGYSAQFNGSISGIKAIMGFEYTIPGTGLALLGGGSYFQYQEISASFEEYSGAIPVEFSAFRFEIGARYDFDI